MGDSKQIQRNKAAHSEAVRRAETADHGMGEMFTSVLKAKAALIKLAEDEEMCGEVFDKDHSKQGSADVHSIKNAATWKTIEAFER